jgi:hypothetical protein
MTKKLVKLAIIRKNEADPCPFALDIPFACQEVGDLVDKMSPVSKSAPDAPALAASNQHLFLWKRPGHRCHYAGKILDPETHAVECNWNSTAAGEEGTPIVGSPWYTKHFSGVGLDGVYTFPLGYYADNSIDRGMYYGMYSIESIASEEDEEADTIDKSTTKLE